MLLRRTYTIVVAYDGTDYHGWQWQQHYPSVTQVLQDSFKKVFFKQISIAGASRTDAGVHAAGQVAFFSTDLILDPIVMAEVWNRALPPSVIIRSAQIADDSFHPMRNVAQKIYYYHFFTERPHPFISRYGWFVWRTVSLEKLRDCLQVFVGTHDFRSFCTTTEEQENTVRTIDSLDVEYLPRYKAVRIIVRGQSFLHYMIRRIVGAAITVASHDHLDRSVLEKALAEKNPQQTLPKAPACGLMLYKINYRENK